MRALAVAAVLLLVGGCATAGTAPTGGPSSPGASPSAPAPSARSAGSADGLIGESLEALRSEVAGGGFAVREQANDAGLPGFAAEATDGGGTFVFAGDPVVAVGWHVAEPMLDNGPLHRLLETHGRADVLPWLDGQLGSMMGDHLVNARAEGVVGDLPILVIVLRAGPEAPLSIDVALGDRAPLTSWLPATTPEPPTPEHWPAELPAAMTGYAEAADEANAGLTTALATLLDGTASLGDRISAARKMLALETAFAERVRALALPEAGVEAGHALVERSVAARAALAPIIAAADPAAVDAALPALVAALNDASASARDLRAILGGYGLFVGSFWAWPEPPAIGAGATVPEPGELEISERGFSLENGSGPLTVRLGNPTPAFAIGVTITVRIDAYEGPEVLRRELVIGAIPPAGSAGVRVAIVDLRPVGLTPQHLTVTIDSIAEWRAPIDPPVGGR